YSVVFLQLLVLISPGIEDPVVERALPVWTNEKIWTIVTDPRVDGLDVMEINLRCGRCIDSISNRCFGVLVVDEQVHDLVWCKRTDHLEIDLFDVGHAVGPGFRILGPR